MGVLIAIFAGFIIFSNGTGAIAFSVLDLAEEFAEQREARGMDGINFVLSHFTELCLIMIFLGVLYLIGGIFLTKYKKWAGQLITAISGLVFIGIWTVIIVMFQAIESQKGMEVFSTGAIITAIIWSIPLVLLIWFLNRKKIRIHFE